MTYSIVIYFSRAVTYVLSNTYHDRWTGTGGSSAWPPRSPNFNPLKICPWGLLKPLMYAAPFHNEEALHHRIEDACQTLRNCSGIFERLRRSMMRRVETCTESHGDISSTYYKYNLSAVTHNLNVSGFRLIWNFFFFWCLELVPKVVLSFQLHL
jgi:hypothetical protein